jgi:UDP-N-acetylglucosamine enolpyruvyl transferase
MQADKYIVEGGQRLEGTITIQSAKNAISKQLVASESHE